MGSEEATTQLELAKKTLTDKYIGPDGFGREDYTSPAEDVLSYADTMIPVLSEQAGDLWKRAAEQARNGRWDDLFLLLLNDGGRMLNDLEHPQQRNIGIASIYLALSLEIKQGLKGYR